MVEFRICRTWPGNGVPKGIRIIFIPDPGSQEYNSAHLYFGLCRVRLPSASDIGLSHKRAKTKSGLDRSRKGKRGIWVFQTHQALSLHVFPKKQPSLSPSMSLCGNAVSWSCPGDSRVLPRLKGLPPSLLSSFSCHPAEVRYTYIKVHYCIFLTTSLLD